MARVSQREYTVLNDREIAASGLANTPSAIAFLRDIQQAAYRDAPADAQAAGQSAADADQKASAAQDTATAAGNSAAAAQVSADAANNLAGSKVTKDVGQSWAAPTGTASRASFATYTAPTISTPPTQAEVQALADALQAHSRALKALVDDLRANHALTN